MQKGVRRFDIPLYRCRVVWAVCTRTLLTIDLQHTCHEELYQEQDYKRSHAGMCVPQHCILVTYSHHEIYYHCYGSKQHAATHSLTIEHQEE